MKFSETFLCCLAVATYVLFVETIVVLALEGSHYVELLRQHTTAPNLWINYAGIFLVPGVVIWLLLRAASTIRQIHRGLSVVVLLVVLALPLAHAPTVLGPALERAFMDPRTLAAIGLASVLATVWLIRAAARKKRRPFDVVATILVAAMSALAVANVCMILRSARQVLSVKGIGLVALGVFAAVILATPLLVGVWRALRTGATKRFGVALGLYAVAYAGLVIFMPVSTGKLASVELASAETPPSVLMIVIDTLREDVVSGPEDPSGLTPNIGRLGRDAVWFDRAYAPSPWTTPSFASILTSTHPWRHNAGHRDPEWGFRSPMTRSLPTLTEFLAVSGYWTGAVTTNPHLSRQFGLDRGFNVYRNLISAWTYHAVMGALRERNLIPGRGAYYVVARDQTSRVEELIRQGRRSDRPFFVLAHYMDPHSPYHAPQTLGNAPKGAETMTERYRAEVAYVDHYVGELLRRLREEGLYDDLLVVLTSDHGEELTELRQNPPNGLRTRDHGHTLFNEALRLPLLIKYPGNANGGTRRDEDVSLIDLAPTILQVVGLPVPNGFEGVNLLADGEPAPGRILFSEGIAHGPEQKSCVRRDDKVILHSMPPHVDYARAYDLASDPGEKHPLLIEEQGGRFLEMYNALVGFIDAQEAVADSTAVEIDPHILRQLKALGYVN